MSANTSAAVTDDATTSQPASLQSSDHKTKADTQSTSSYANIVQKDGHEKSKSKKSDDGAKKSSKVPSADETKDTDTVKQTAQEASPANESTATDATVEAEDDSSFTPVVSHNRKDRNNRRNKDQQPAAATRPNNGSTKNGKAARQPRSERSKDATSKRPKGGDKDKSGAHSDSSANASQSADVSKITPTSSEAGNAGEDGTATAAEKKFIEAPLPKVNAWKVSVPVAPNFPVQRISCDGAKFPYRKSRYFFSDEILDVPISGYIFFPPYQFERKNHFDGRRNERKEKMKLIIFLHRSLINVLLCHSAAAAITKIKCVCGTQTKANPFS